VKVEVIERHVIEIEDADYAADVRQAVKDGDTERIDELIGDYLNHGGDMGTSEYTKVRIIGRKGRAK
jgi:hypothetical protein